MEHDADAYIASAKRTLWISSEEVQAAINGSLNDDED